MLSECSGIAIFGGSVEVVNSRRFIAAILWKASPTAIVQTGLISPSETPPTSRFATAGHGSSCRRRRRRTDGSGSRRHAPQGVHVDFTHGIDLADRAGGEDRFDLCHVESHCFQNLRHSVREENCWELRLCIRGKCEANCRYVSEILLESQILLEMFWGDKYLIVEPLV